ncbi:hypothetical protein Ahy_A07g032344 [Arachis hypogaea]|uniref:Uncharacterized protein n=1 Tax=Arachis hypogaea TaxID=3818 RepID=A0A445C6Q8_ARAHY|nr:hypothetical protein Ahy_A07g032344 [Arachis hypogaea]
MTIGNRGRSNLATEPAMGDSSNASQQDAPPPPSVIQMRIWPDGIQAKIYDHRTTKRFQQMMSNVHQGRNHLMIWICPSIKKELEAHFRTDEGFKHRRLTNLTNRASSRSSKYTGGSATFIKTKSRLRSCLLFPRRVSHTLAPPNAIILYLRVAGFGDIVQLKDVVFDNS